MLFIYGHCAEANRLRMAWLCITDCSNRTNTMKYGI